MDIYKEVFFISKINSKIFYKKALLLKTKGSNSSTYLLMVVLQKPWFQISLCIRIK